jgi:hypothetical protein
MDNGRGINANAIERLLAPDVTDKADLFRNGKSRGHKGVGLTFLAYGFNFFELESRTQTEHYRVRLENARRWVLDPMILAAPQAMLTELADDEGELRQTGTMVTIQVGPQTEPQELHRTFASSEYSITVLETQTAIGVFPSNPPAPHASTFSAQLDYVTRDGTPTSHQLASSYRFPHVKLKSGARTLDVGAYLRDSPPTQVPARLQRRHESVYRFYPTDQLVEMLRGRAAGDRLATDADIEELLRRHRVLA